MNMSEIIGFTVNLKKLHLDDPDNVVEIIARFLIGIKLIFFDNKTPVIWCHKYYRRITDDDLEAIILNLLDSECRMAVSNTNIREVIKRIRYTPELQIDLQKSFWEGQQYINLSNGVYSIMEQKIVPVRNNYKFDYVIDFQYTSNRKLENAPVFRKYIESSVGEDNYECLMRSLGYCLSSLTKGRKAFLLLGKGKTGKSTLLNLLESVLSMDLVSHEPFHTMSNERARSHYIGKRVNISRDNSSTPMRREEAFKSLISCEKTTGREVYEKGTDFTPTLSFIFASNNPLVFANPDDAVLDRLVVILFTREIPENQLDPDLEDKLIKEKDVIFSIAVDKLKELVTSGYDFRMANDAQEFIRQQRLLIHSAEDFLSEKVITDKNGSVSSAVLYGCYVDFCHKNAVKPVGRNTFLDKVRNCFTDIRYDKVYSGNDRVNGFRGIRLTSMPDEAETDGTSVDKSK